MLYFLNQVDFSQQLTHCSIESVFYAVLRPALNIKYFPGKYFDISAHFVPKDLNVSNKVTFYSWDHEYDGELSVFNLRWLT